MTERKSNRLFLFKPSKGWSYCGGATILCAESLDDAIVLGNELKSEKTSDGHDAYRIAETSSYSPGFAREGEQYCLWVFVEEFVLVEFRPVGLVFTNANHA